MRLRNFDWAIRHPIWTAAGVVLATVIGVIGLYRAPEPLLARVHVFEAEANIGTPQETGIVLGPNDKARISPVGTWGVIDPTKRGPTTALGNGIEAGPTYALHGNGSREGCLIVSINNTNRRCFASRSGSEILSGPGEIVFGVNDDIGLGQPSKRLQFQEFRDNSGSIRIFIEINPGS